VRLSRSKFYITITKAQANQLKLQAQLHFKALFGCIEFL
jgi:hypothetical protein